MAKEDITVESLQLELEQARVLIEQLKKVIQFQEGQIQKMKTGDKIPAKEIPY